MNKTRNLFSAKTAQKGFRVFDVMLFPPYPFHPLAEGQPKESLTVYLPSDVDLKTDITIHYTTLYETLAAPVKSGDIAGQVTVMYNDEILGTVDLITTADISRSEFLYMLSQIEEFTKSKGFIAFAVSAVVLSVGYVLIQAFRRGRAARRL